MTPIVIFAYKRPNHLKESLEALSRTTGLSGRAIYIFCDGPKNNSDRVNTEEVLEVVKTFSNNFLSYITVNKENNGLGNSIINGIDHVLTEHESCIVMEDDIKPMQQFLLYFDKALSLYRDRPDIFTISSYSPKHLIDNYPCANTKSTFLIPRMQCWGWATWRHKWRFFKNYREYYNELLSNTNLQKEYEQIIGSDSLKTLKACMEEGKDVWACKWVLTHFYHGASCICPRYALSENIGLDGSGTNCGKQARIDYEYKEISLETKNFTSERFIDLEIFNLFMNRDLNTTLEQTKSFSRYEFIERSS